MRRGGQPSTGDGAKRPVGQGAARPSRSGRTRRPRRPRAFPNLRRPRSRRFSPRTRRCSTRSKEDFSGPAPNGRWTSRSYFQRVPNLSGQMRLARVLVGRAEARAAAKDARAEESLRAAFALTGSLRGRRRSWPTRLDRRQVSWQARATPVDAAAWRARLETLDPRAGMLGALRGTAERGCSTRRRRGCGRERLRRERSARAAFLSRFWRERISSAAYLDAWRAAGETAAKSPVEDAETKG